MAHQIETYGDQAAFVAARTPGWHKLGTVFTDRDALTVDEALEAAHLDWTVDLEPVYAVTTEAGMVHDPRHRATVRTNPFTGEREVLGIVGTSYRPLNNRDAFAFLGALHDESGAYVETAGSLLGGRKVFVTSRFPESMTLDPEGAADVIDLYTLASNSHDGTSSFRLAVTPTRVVCANTETVAFLTAKRTVSLQHRSGLAGQVQEAREALGVTWRYMDAWTAAAEKLIQTTMTDAEWETFLAEHLVPDAEEGAPTVVTNRIDDRRQELTDLWHGPTNDNIRGTRWAAWNVWTEWLDHIRPTRDGDSTKREEAIVEGIYSADKTRAFRELLPA